MFDVVALGEILIDFTPAGFSPSGNALFERNPGGAPANVAAAVARLGGSAAFIGKVGNDQFGRFLKRVLEENRIDTRGLRFSGEANTTLAFVHLDERGERSFSFYRNPGADTLLTVEDLDLTLIDEAKIFHFGSLSLTHEPSRSACLAAVEHARRAGKVISYDPNWRPPLWENDDVARSMMSLGLEMADVVKLSEAELELLTGSSDLNWGTRELMDRGIRLVVVTLGAKGCYYRSHAGTGHLPTYKAKVVDTTGAGDAFVGGLLFQLARLGGMGTGLSSLDLQALSASELERMLAFANAVGALSTSKRGGIPSMPCLREVEECLARGEVLAPEDAEEA